MSPPSSAQTIVPLYPGPRFPTPAREAATRVIYVQLPDGTEHGPLTQRELEMAAGTGQLDGNALVWQESWPDSKLAGELYPELVPIQQVSGAGGARTRVIAGTTVHPYARQDPDGLGRSWHKALWIVLVIVGIQLAALEIILGVAGFVGVFLLLIAGLGMVLLHGGLQESDLVFNSYLGAWVRSRAGDRGTYVLVLTVGGLTVLLLYGKVFLNCWQAL